MCGHFGIFVEYFQDDFRILIMADSELKKLLSLLCNHCTLSDPLKRTNKVESTREIGLLVSWSVGWSLSLELDPN